MRRKLSFEPLEGRLMLSLAPVVDVPDFWYVGDHHKIVGEDFPVDQRARMAITLSDSEVIRDRERTDENGYFSEGMTIPPDAAGGITIYRVTAGGVTVSEQFMVIADPTLFVPENITVSDTDKIRVKGSGFIDYYQSEEVYFFLAQGDNSWSLDHDDVNSRGRVNELMHVRDQDDLVNGAAVIEARLENGTLITSSPVNLNGCYEVSSATSATIVVPDFWYVGDYHKIVGDDFPVDRRANITITLSDGEVITDRDTTDEDGHFSEGITIFDSAGGVATIDVTCGGVTVSEQFMVIADPTLFVPETIEIDHDYKVTGKGFYPYLDDEVYFFAGHESSDWVLIDHDGIYARGRINETIFFPDNLVNGLNTIEVRLADGTVLASATTTIVGGVEPLVDEPLVSLPELSSSPFAVILVLPTTQASISAPVGAPSPANGELEQQSLAERTAREIALTETIERIGLTYEDKGRGVDVYAPTGQYFVEYANGAVELRYIPANLPAGQGHPTKEEITVNGRSSPNLGQVSKPPALTGRTFFDPARGIDVHAGEGKFLIQYEDGTVEERDLPPGGFVPLPTDFTVGGPDNSQSMIAFGPSFEELGLIDPVTNQPKSSEELYLIGETYVSSSGILRTAHEGNVFLQDPVTKIILERPKEAASVALTKPNAPPASVHSTSTVTDLFFQAYGREPTGLEAMYWQSRTDKEGAALLGAMQYAVSQDVTVTLNSSDATPKAVDEVFASLGQTPVSVGDYNAVALTWEWTSDLFTQDDVNDQLSLILNNQGVHVENVLQWMMDYPIAPSTVDGLEYYRDSPLYIVASDPDFVVDKFHPEADSAYRIYRIGQLSGNQALYDASGNLIGTSPDLVSPLYPFLGVLFHQVFDVAAHI